MAVQSHGSFRVVKVKKDATFKELCAAHGLHSFKTCFYELVQKEKIGAKKRLVSSSAKNGAWVFDGEEVRKTLKLPKHDAPISPSDVPSGWSLFVQSTSPNRQLKANTIAVIELPGSAAVKSKSTASAPTPKAEKNIGVNKRPASASFNGSPTKSPKVDAQRTKDDKDGWKWYGTLMYYEFKTTKPSDRIAAFDYDGCLANTSLFRKGPNAWSVLFPGVTESVLKELHKKGYKLVIMTNQSAIGSAKASFEKTVAEKKGRLEGFVKHIGLPCQILVATGKDSYRKPAAGMWKFLEDTANGDVKINRKESLFVGDAAGRPKDHADSDLKFAKALGVAFFTETQMFKEKAYQHV